MTPPKGPDTPSPASSVMIRSTVDAPMGGTTVGDPDGFDGSAGVGGNACHRRRTAGVGPGDSGGVRRLGGGAAVSRNGGTAGLSASRGRRPGAPPTADGRTHGGRQGDVEALEGWFQRAAQGARQLVFVGGEAGVGKTTVVEAFLARLAAESGVRMGRGQCAEHTGMGEPYLPVLEALGQLNRGPRHQDVLAALRRYAPMSLVQTARAPA
jgi:AAA ATPase domain